MSEQVFELYLDSDPTIQGNCLNEIHQKFGSEPKSVYDDTLSEFSNFFDVTLDDDRNIWDIARDLASIPGVIEVDPITKLFGIFNKSRDNDDFTQNTQWNHSLTNFNQAIESSIQAGKLDPTVGIENKIVQLDTGYTLHPEIGAIDSDTGLNFVNGEDSEDPLDILASGIMDQPGHGTSTASVIIGAKTTEPGDRNNGVFPFVNLIPYRISPSVIHITGNTIGPAVIKAVDSGCDIITMSMGGAPPRLSWRKAAEYALSKGVIFISAAGNEVHFVVWPARYKEVIAVAGVNFEGLPWEGSCWGSSVTISAPAENVFVASVSEVGKFLYKHGSGTSYATPHIAAAAALWLNHFKDELDTPLFTNNPSERVRAFKYALTESAQVPQGWTEFYKRNFGRGILDAKRLIEISPSDYIASAQVGMFSNFLALDSMREEKSPSLIQKEMIYLLLNNDSQNANELDGFITENGSERAVAEFEKMRLGPSTIAGTFGVGGLLFENVNGLRSVYLDRLADNW